MTKGAILKEYLRWFGVVDLPEISTIDVDISDPNKYLVYDMDYNVIFAITLEAYEGL